MKKFSVIFAVLLILGAGAAFYQALVGVQSLEGVMVAKGDIPAYTSLNKDQLKEVKVPKASITAENLTQKEYQNQFIKPNKPLITTSRILENQRVDKRQIVQSGQGSFAMVAPDERVVAVSTTISGAAIGTINSGDVVDVGGSSSGLSSAGSADFAKVLCIATTPAACRGVLPAGMKINAPKDNSGGGGDAVITVLLAVAQDQAGSIAGQTVSLSLNPSCRVNERGQFVVAREGLDPSLCQPGGRESASAETSDSTDSSPTDEGTTGTTGKTTAK